MKTRSSIVHPGYSILKSCVIAEDWKGRHKGLKILIIPLSIKIPSNTHHTLCVSSSVLFPIKSLRIWKLFLLIHINLPLTTLTLPLSTSYPRQCTILGRFNFMSKLLNSLYTIALFFSRHLSRNKKDE